MHHAYPSECSFPFLPGASKAPNDVEPPIEVGRRVRPDDISVSEEIPWLEEEELFLVCRSPPEEVASIPRRNWLQDAILLVLACCMVGRLVQTFMPAAVAMGWLPKSVVGHVHSAGNHRPECKPFV